MRTAALCLVTCAAVISACQSSSAATSGTYMETRTCQVYTGPCFANGEVGLAGKDAMMAWTISKGTHKDVDISGLSVVMAVQGDATFGFGGFDDAKELKSVVLVDEKADSRQRAALVDFARTHSGRAGEHVVRVADAPIQMKLNTQELSGSVTAGSEAKLVARKARPGDCICSNEAAYYPPLAKVSNFAPGVAVEGQFKGRGLGSRWSVPDSRSVYMATFDYGTGIR